MSKKTTPTVGPTRRPRRSTNRMAGQSAEATSRPGGRIRRTATPTATVDVDAPDPTWRSRLRKFLPVALWPNGFAVVIIIAIAIMALLITSTPMAALAATVAQSWLVINAAPVVGMDNTIGLLPLVPAMLLALAVSARVHKAIKDKVSLMDLVMLFACVLGVPVVLTLIAVLTLIDAAKVYPVAAPNVFVAIGRVLLLHFLALVIGMGIRLWRALARRFGLPEWLVDQAINAIKMLSYAVIASAVVVIGSIVVHYGKFVELLALYQGWGAVAVIVLSLLYLPNLAVATMSVAAGGEFVIGDGLVTIFNVVAVPLPPLPLLAAVPATAHPAAVVLLIIAPLAAVLALVKQVPRIVEVTGFVLFVMLFTFIAALLSSGQLGFYGTTGPNIFLAAGFMGLWAFVVGIIMSAVGLLLRRRSAAAPATVVTSQPEEESELAEDLEELENLEAAEAEHEEEDENQELDYDAEATAEEELEELEEPVIDNVVELPIAAATDPENGEILEEETTEDDSVAVPTVVSLQPVGEEEPSEEPRSPQLSTELKPTDDEETDVEKEPDEPVK